MGEEVETTVKIDRKGRITIKQDQREFLGIDGKEAWLDLEIEVREVLDGE